MTRYVVGSIKQGTILNVTWDCRIGYIIYNCFTFQAFSLFPELLKKLHGLEWDALQEALAIGMLAGNVFDWGAKVLKRHYILDSSKL